MSRITSSDQPMCLGNWPLTMVLWLTTVSEAIWPTVAFLKLAPWLSSHRTFLMRNALAYQGFIWSMVTMTTWVGLAAAAAPAATSKTRRTAIASRTPLRASVMAPP